LRVTFDPVLEESEASRWTAVFGRTLAGVHGVSRLAFVGWFAAATAGCAAITGLDGVSEENCAPLCDDAGNLALDGPADRATAPDGLPRWDAGDVADSPGEVPATENASPDGGTGRPVGDAGEASPPDAGSSPPGDAPFGGPFPDAPFDSSCGPLNTTTNCSACTDTCASELTVETSSACRGDATGLGATCSYACASGYQDCNAASPPDLDGCECHVPGATQAQCCLGTGSCPAAHDNGLNQATSTFFDCQGSGQFSLALATDACVAFTGVAGQCTEEICESPDGSADGDLVVCSAGSPTDCVCWTYQGTNAGYLRDPRFPPDAGCFCADRSTGDPTYE
jgi:hypothetical protein